MQQLHIFFTLIRLISLPPSSIIIVYNLKENTPLNLSLLLLTTDLIDFFHTDMYMVIGLGIPRNIFSDPSSKKQKKKKDLWKVKEIILNIYTVSSIVVVHTSYEQCRIWHSEQFCILTSFLIN